MAKKNMVDDLIDNMIDKIFEYLFKFFIKILKIMWKVFKKGFANIRTIRKTLKNKEKYLFIVSIIIPIIFIWMYKLHPGLFFLCLNYFWIKATFQIGKEEIKKMKIEKLTARHKKLNEIFGDRLKVVEVKKDKVTIFSDELTVKDIENKIPRLESYFKRKISFIQRQNNFRYYDIVFYFETNFEGFYKFEDYINLINPKKIKTMFLPIFLGLDEKLNLLIEDLTEIRHMFVSGLSGNGKSTILNSIIQSLMIFNNNVELVLIDLKEGVEMSDYDSFPNCAIISNTRQLKKAIDNLDNEMIRRLQLIRSTENCKNIQSYNSKSNIKDKMSYIVVIIDEFAEIKLNGDSKDIENTLLQILQKGRVAGIHVIGATQRPSGDLMDTNVRSGFLYNISFGIKKIETQKMTGIKGTESLNKGEFKTDIRDDMSKIWKGLFISEEENTKKKLPKSNGVYEDLKHFIADGKEFIFILPKQQKKLSLYKRLLQYITGKLNKELTDKLTYNMDYRQLIKSPSKQVINSITDLKKLSEIEEITLGDADILHTDNYKNFLNFIYRNCNIKTGLIPEGKEIIEALRLKNKYEKDKLVTRAYAEEYINKASQTRYKINLKSPMWKDYM